MNDELQEHAQAHIEHSARRTSDRDFKLQEAGQRRAEIRSWIATVVAVLAFGAVVFVVLTRTDEAVDVSRQRLATSQETQLIIREIRALTRDLKSQGDEIEASQAKTEQLLQFADTITSPEAKAAQQAQVQALVNQIGCDNREVVQEVVTGLERSGILEAGSISVACSSSTTTEAGR